MEKFREINELLELQNLSLDDLKDMLGEKKVETQEAS